MIIFGATRSASAYAGLAFEILEIQDWNLRLCGNNSGMYILFEFSQFLCEGSQLLSKVRAIMVFTFR